MSDPPARLIVFDHHGMEEHDPGWGRPDRPVRLQVARAVMTGWEGLEFRRPGRASRGDLLAVHTPTYVDWICSLEGREWTLGPELALSAGSVGAALLAVGAVVEAVREVCRPGAGARRALCLVRPPGHRALPDAPAGPCVFNQVAVGAVVAAREGLSRVLVIDWDARPGAGTSAALAGRTGHLVVDLHAASADALGALAGGNTVRIPLPPGSGHDEVAAAVDCVLLPAAEAFRPDLVLVSAGFGAHADDPFEGLCARDETFYLLARAARGIADRYGSSRLVVSLEEGTDLLSMGRSLRHLVRALLEESHALR